MEMNELEEKLHRTWIDILLTGGFTKEIELVLDADLSITYGGYDPDGIAIDSPATFAVQVNCDDEVRRTLEKTLRLVLHGADLPIKMGGLLIRRKCRLNFA